MLRSEFDKARLIDDKIKSINNILNSFNITIEGEYYKGPERDDLGRPYIGLDSETEVFNLDEDLKNKIKAFLLLEKDELQREFNNLLCSRKDEGIE